MNTYKKWFLLALVLVLASSLLLACTSNNNDNNDSTQPIGGGNGGGNEDGNEGNDDRNLEGTIRIALPAAPDDVWEAVAEAYMDLHPDVDVIVDNKPLEGYQEWLTAQFATGGTPDVDIVAVHMTAQLQSDGAFLNYYPWLAQENPYTGDLWQNNFDLESMGINMAAVTDEDTRYDLNFESIQIVWVYNQEIYAEAGFTEAPQTFNEMMEMWEAIEELGYTPFTVGGTDASMWSGAAGWPIRIYADQYTRDWIQVARSQPQDFTYFADIDDIWEFDLSDPYNDNPHMVTSNEMRVWKAIQEKQGPYHLEEPRWADFYENIKRMFNYTPEGFFGLSDQEAYEMFLTGEAATMLGSPGVFWQLPRDFETSELEGGVDPFEFGFFNFPSMEGEHVMAPARTIHVPIGFYGIVDKDAEQNALNVDFMRFVTSPVGYNVYLQATVESDEAALAGPPSIVGIELPQEMQEAFDAFEPVGNMEGMLSAAVVLARGLHHYQPNVQDWVNLMQQFLRDQITVDEYLSRQQANVDRDLENQLEELNFRLSDLENPERRPPDRN